MLRVLTFFLLLLLLGASCSPNSASQEGPGSRTKEEDYSELASLDNLFEAEGVSRRSLYIKGSPIGSGRYSNVFFAWEVDLSPEAKSRLGDDHLVVDPGQLNLTDGEVSVFRGSPVALKELKSVQEWKVVREVSILRLLNDPSERDFPPASVSRGKDFIIRLLDIVRYRHPLKKAKKGGVSKKSVGLVMEYVKNRPFYSLLPGLGYGDLQNYMRQLMQGLAYSHSLGIFHRDIKPQNIVIDASKRLLKIIDWGLAEYYSAEDPDFSPRVASKHYKAPELLLGIRNYDFSVDSWSTGCLFAQMLFRLGTARTNYFTRFFSEHPDLFVGVFLRNSPSPDVLFPGWDNSDQLVKIASLLGGDNVISVSNKYNGTIPDDLTLSYLHRTQRVSNFTTPSFTDPATFGFLITPENRDLVTLEAVDLLSQLLTLDYRSRIHPREALQHPFFALHHSQHTRILRPSLHRKPRDFCPLASLFSLVRPRSSLVQTGPLPARDLEVRLKS